MSDQPAFDLPTRSRVPVVRRVLADQHTPLGIYLKFADQPYSYLLESVHGGERWGRYSIIGLPCRERVRVCGTTLQHERDGELLAELELDDPLAWIDAFQRAFDVPPLPELPRFTGGLVGYFGYDTIRYIEPRLAGRRNPDPLELPDILLMVSDELVVFDNLRGLIYLIVHATPDTPRARVEARADVLLAQMLAPPDGPRRRLALDAEPRLDAFEASFTQAGYEAAVRTIQRYIAAGDVMQVVPSQRMSIDFTARPTDLYRALRYLNPSPYMFHLNLDHFSVVGASPEVLVRLEEGQLSVRPIAGTRPRGRDEAEDAALAAELLGDPKERAEHLMLIDLGRNDVGRVSQIGSVELTERMVIERYSHVMHIVSNVRGRLTPGLSAIDALRATFPAGTLTGAPKIRAMEIIDELEPVARGVYAGAVGYIGWQGNMDTAIAIRTAVIKDGRLHVQAGGGIVADSVPALEWEETLNKRRAMFRAVAIASSEAEGG